MIIILYRFRHRTFYYIGLSNYGIKIANNTKTLLRAHISSISNLTPFDTYSINMTKKFITKESEEFFDFKFYFCKLKEK